ncbi:MAG: alpha/beta fold hydrolase [Acidimicrobiales bacterium]
MPSDPGAAPAPIPAGPTAPHPVTTLRVTGAGGVCLHVLARRLDSNGTPVLLVHGLASNARLWDGVADRLAGSGHPVAALDQRGHGLSGKPDGGYDFETLTDDLMAVIGHLGWDREDRPPFVAGQSWGANVVLELAARRPRAAAGVALVDGGTIDLADRFADWATCEAAMAPPLFDGITAASFEEMIRRHHPDWPEEGIAGTLANVEVLDDGTIRPWLSRTNHMRILRHMWDQHPSRRYALVTAPALLLPAEDRSNHRWMHGKREAVEAAGAGLSRSVTRWIAGDHDLHAQHPGLVAGLVHDATRPSFFPT